MTDAEKIEHLKSKLWAQSILLAIATGDRSHAKDKTIPGMSEGEWQAKLLSLRAQYGLSETGEVAK